jgi:hypothetical protein
VPRERLAGIAQTSLVTEEAFAINSCGEAHHRHR